MWISRYFVWFVIYSIMGWLYETFYCIFTTRKWENRGFLYGPLCPIYGVGALAVSVMGELADKGRFPVFSWWQIFLICFFGSMFLEYGTSWVLEKLFHAVWWDYSGLPLNVNGRICLPATLGFGLAGILVNRGLYPAVKSWTSVLPPVLIELVSLVIMAFVAMDVTLTVSTLTNFERFLTAMNAQLDDHMTSLVAGLAEKTQDVELRLLQEKERFANWNAENMVSHMSRLRQSALKRVVAFRLPQLPARKTMQDKVLHVLRRLKSGRE